MALADYYARNAVAASQVLAGFDEERIRAALADARVGIAIGTEVAKCWEARTLIDLLVRLLARLYPTLVIRGETGAQEVVETAKSLATDINPRIDFEAAATVEVVVGTSLPRFEGCQRIFAGSDGWHAFLGLDQQLKLGTTYNPFGPGVAACLAAANVFRWIFQGHAAALDKDLVFSAFDNESHQTDTVGVHGSLGEILLVGAGAIGNGAAWAFSRLQMEGVLHIVDHEKIDLGNLQRYVLAQRFDENKMKVDVVSRHFGAGVQVEAQSLSFQDFVSAKGYSWPRMILALDTARDRRAAQASLPKWVANAWTQPGDLGISCHDFLSGACVHCMYLPEQALENEDAIIASALGVSDKLMQVRTLLHTGGGVMRDLLESIAIAHSLSINRLLPFEGRPIRSLYTEGFCGGAVLPLGSVGKPRQEVHVPLAHQSALAGVLLAAVAVRNVLDGGCAGTQVTRIDVMHPLGSVLTQPAAKDARGICICQDDDYREVYRRKYAESAAPESA